MEDDLAKLTDDDLKRRFHDHDGEAGDADCDALAAEMQRRHLDF